MRSIQALTLLIAASAFMFGCSKVGFQSVPKQSCSNSNMSADTSCSVTGQNLQYNFSFDTGQVDILFVDDNSGSMYSVQTNIAQRLNYFLSNISSLDYQIAVVTTDISSSVNPTTGETEQPKPANGYGAFQDGKFLQFTNTSGTPATDSSGNPLYVINRNTPNAENLFAGTIQRRETLTCEQDGFVDADCPSDVARGIYAVNDAIDRNQDSFFRPGTHLAVIMLTDSDECENGVTPYNCGSDYMNDEPATLVQNMTSKFPTKSISVHSIVVPTQSCGAPTSNPNGIQTYGIMGTTYMELSQPDAALTSLGDIVPGNVGDICATDYSSQLSDIGSIVQQQSHNSPIQMACNPQNLTISTTPASAVSQLHYSIDSQNRITFSGLSNGVNVSVSYECPRY